VAAAVAAATAILAFSHMPDLLFAAFIGWASYGHSGKAANF